MIYRIIRFLLLPLFRRHIARIEGVEHLPKNEGFLLAANHIDYLDGFFLSTAIGHKPPRLVKFLSVTNNYWWTGGATIPIDWSNKAGAVTAALKALDAGSIICVFPEGQRNSSKQLLRGKTGLARLALWSGRPVVPVGMIGPEGKSFLDSLRTLLFRNAPVTIRIGAPIHFTKRAPEDTSKEVLTSTMTTIMEALGQQCNKTYSQ